MLTSVNWSHEEQDLSIAFLRDLSHVTTDFFAKISEQSVMSRRLIATEAVNLVDPSALLAAPLGTDLFGGAWPKVAEADLSTRKRKAEQAKLKAPTAGGKRGRGRGQVRSRAARQRPAMVQVPVQYQQVPQQWAYPGQGPVFQLPAQAPAPPVNTRGRQRRGGRAARGARGNRARGRGRGARAARDQYSMTGQQQQHF